MAPFLFRGVLQRPYNNSLTGTSFEGKVASIIFTIGIKNNQPLNPASLKRRTPTLNKGKSIRYV